LTWFARSLVDGGMLYNDYAFCPIHYRRLFGDSGLSRTRGIIFIIGVVDVAAQILPECVAQLVVVFGEQRLDGFQLGSAPRRRAVWPARKYSRC
jgi:hypothetical protein